MLRAPNAIRLFCLLAILVPRTSGAQVGAGQITGIITDAGNAPVPGVTITATQARSAARRTAVSSSSGVFTLPSLAPGEYRIDIELTGFRPIRRQGIRIETGET